MIAALKVGFRACRWIAIAALVFVAAVFLSETPQFWTGLILAVMCLVAMRRNGTRRRRIVYWNAAAVLFTWSLFELGARLSMGHGVQPTFPRAALIIRLSQLFDPPVLAGRPPPEAETGASGGKRAGSPAAAVARPEGCVLFFGCSYTYCEGVGDDQTFAALVQSKTDERFVTVNFGVSGSGPHYALAQLEDGIVARDAPCTPTHAIYLVLPHHLVRVAGKWAVPFGPRYELQSSDKVVRHGSLVRTTSGFAWDIFRYTSTLFVAKYGYGYGDEASVDESDFRLIVALLRTVSAGLLERYPGIRFDILYWDEQSSALGRQLGTELKGVGAPVHELAAILPEIRRPGPPAYLPNDPHPSAWAHERIADYIVANLLQAK